MISAGRREPGHRIGRDDGGIGTEAKPIALHERVRCGAHERSEVRVDRHRRRGPDPRREIAYVVATKLVRLELDRTGDPAALRWRRPNEYLAVGNGGAARERSRRVAGATDGDA